MSLLASSGRGNQHRLKIGCSYLLDKYLIQNLSGDSVQNVAGVQPVVVLSLVPVFERKLGVQLLHAVIADPVTELRFGMSLEVLLEVLPVSGVVANFLAGRTD